MGENLFVESQASGPAALAEAATGGRGVVHQGTLEQSNVDISEEFIDMIRFQRLSGELKDGNDHRRAVGGGREPQALG